MQTRRFALILIVMLIGRVVAADVVVERWGLAGRVQHADAIMYEDRGEAGVLMRVDLSALPDKATVYRARLTFERPGRMASGFQIVPVQRTGEDPAAEVKAVDRPLAVAPPHHQWFDATSAAQRWAKEGRREGLLLIAKAPRYEPKGTVLEIAYEGKPANPPKPASDVAAFYRNGQVFVTFREIENYAGGKEEITWGELAERLKDIRYEGPIPKDDKGELRYRVYRHDKPITRETIGQAELLGEVPPASMYNTRLVPGGDFISRRGAAVALRLAVEPEKPLPPGSGLYVHTVSRGGQHYYAVVTSLNGVENTVQLDGCVAGPVEQRRATPEPVLQRDVVTEFRDGRTYHERWYSYWAGPPQAPRPIRYDLAVGLCPESMTRPAPLTFTRGHTWGPGPEMPGPTARRGIVMSMNTDPPNGYWTGIHECRDTLRGVEEGTWQPFTHNRLEALIRWAQKTWEVDEQRIVGSIGAWGMWEIRRADLYAYIHGWGMPEVTKGFQCWDWARGAWGPPEMYKDAPPEANPWVLQDYTAWVLANPDKELPYFQIHTGWGAHFTEMGWPPYPRFIRAMMDTKRAFCMQSPAVGAAMSDGLVDIRRDQSVPAFGNCSLDDNIGDGDLGSGHAFGQINGYLVWQSDTIVDEPALYQITVWLWPGDSYGRGAAPLEQGTVDLTPRRCQKFVAKPDQRFVFTSVTTADGKTVQSGEVVADKHGLVTIPSLVVTKSRHRITIRLK